MPRLWMRCAVIGVEREPISFLLFLHKGSLQAIFNQEPLRYSEEKNPERLRRAVFFSGISCLNPAFRQGEVSEKKGKKLVGLRVVGGCAGRNWGRGGVRLCGVKGLIISLFLCEIVS